MSQNREALPIDLTDTIFLLKKQHGNHILIIKRQHKSQSIQKHYNFIKCTLIMTQLVSMLIHYNPVASAQATRRKKEVILLRGIFKLLWRQLETVNLSIH